MLILYQFSNTVIHIPTMSYSVKISTGDVTTNISCIVYVNNSSFVFESSRTDALCFTYGGLSQKTYFIGESNHQPHHSIQSESQTRLLTYAMQN